MDVSWLVLLVSAAVFLSLILLAAVCMDCRNKGPLVSIRQVNASEEYMPSTEFVVIHSYDVQDVPPPLAESQMGLASGPCDPLRHDASNY